LERRALSFENETVLFEEPKRTAELAVLVVPQGTETTWCCESVSWWNERIMLEERMLVSAMKNMKLRKLRPNERVNRPSRERKIGWNRRFGG
jgi:hypothetical protein